MFNSIEYKNILHKHFAEIYAKTCLIMSNTSYHNDNGVWYCTTRKMTYMNDSFTLIYQPKKGAEYYENDTIVCIIISNTKKKIKKSFIHEVQYIMDYIHTLCIQSFQWFIQQEENSSHYRLQNPRFDTTNFFQIMNIKTPMYCMDGKLYIQFGVLGFDECESHSDWEPVYLHHFIEKIL